MVTQAYIGRVLALKHMIEPAASVDSVAKSQILATFTRALEIAEVHPGIVGPADGQGSLEERTEEILKEFPLLAIDGDELALLDWTRRFNEAIRRVVLNYVNATQRTEPDANEDALQIAHAYLSALETDNQTAAAVQEALVFRARAEQSAVAAEQAASAAQTSAGITADARLGEYFEKYAASELRTSMWFRLSTIASLAGTVAFAILLPHSNTSDISSIVYRAAAVLGVAAFAAYLGRQAGQHRKNGNWARSLEVQLKSFDAFIAPVAESSSRHEIYELFARRVLGAPPENRTNEQKGVDPQIVDLLTLMARRVQN